MEVVANLPSEAPLASTGVSAVAWSSGSCGCCWKPGVHTMTGTAVLAQGLLLDGVVWCCFGGRDESRGVPP